MKKNKKIRNMFDQFALKITRITGSTTAFLGACGTILAWLVAGPLFKYSDTWQLVINTGTTIITFLMVFLIQKTQNKDSLAIQLKLNELVASSEWCSNRMIDVENLSEQELLVLQKYFRRMAEMAKKEADLTASHSIEEAEKKHHRKRNKKIKVG